MSTTTHGWSRLVKIPGGHSYWTRGASPDVYVADDSMRDPADPTTTEDGALVLRRDETVKLIQNRALGAPYLWLPALALRGTGQSRFTAVTESFWPETLLALRTHLEPNGIVFALDDLRAAVREVLT
jgi:hypothetical protein